jgi:2'-5' RNA ligase
MARDRSTRPEAKPVRLFVAVEVPGAAKRIAEAAVAPIREGFPRARWAPPENWHVTLKFLGTTYPRLVGWVRETVARVAAGHEPVPTHLTGLGSFPSPGRTRVLWVGLDDADGRLAAIAADLEEAFAPRFRPEGRAFTPHLTVARSDPPLRIEPEMLATAVDAPGFTIDRLVLFRSYLRRPAPRYEALETYPLGGASEGSSDR